MRIPKISSRRTAGGTVRYFCKIGYKQVSLGTDLAIAEREVIRLAFEHERKTSPVDGRSPCIHAVAYEWLDWVKIHRAASTYDQHKRIMLLFLDSIHPDMRVEELKRHHVLDWIESVPGWRNGGRTQGICTVHACLSWCCKRDKIPYNPIEKIERPEKGHRETILTDDQKHLILSSIESIEFRNVFVFCLEQGVRPHEARTLTARQINFDAKTVRFDRNSHKTGRKTMVSRFVYLTPASANLLRQLVRKFPTGPVFRDEANQPWTRHTIHRRFRKLRTKHAELPQDLSTYVLRHTYVTEALAAGMSDVVVAELAGHSDPTMIQRTYGHMRKKKAAMLEAAAKLSVIRADGVRHLVG